jgi:hypothetical protein
MFVRLHVNNLLIFCFIFSSNFPFTLVPGKTTYNLDGDGWSQDLPDALRTLANSVVK